MTRSEKERRKAVLFFVAKFMYIRLTSGKISLKCRGGYFKNQLGNGIITKNAANVLCAVNPANGVGQRADRA